MNNNTISFYPGPSQLYPEVGQYMQEAFDSGILSANHRSTPFMAMMGEAIEMLREKLAVPKQYHIYFTSSATECWEIVSQSYESLPSLHLYNGAFGEKWFKSRQALHPHAVGKSWNYQRMLGHQQLDFPFDKGLLCLTQNETSNGTQVRNRLIGKVHKRFSQALTCIDATSSMAGVELDWLSGDIWYASVQKCFGLPSGMAVLVVSPKALEWAGENKHYNSLIRIHENAEKFQTTHTPNILGIYLLGKVMSQRESIKKVSNRIKLRGQQMRKELREAGYSLLIEQERLQSDTVIAVKVAAEKLVKLKEGAQEAGFVLGNGYGQWKENTIRIANFPAISDEAVEGLIRYLRSDT